MKKMSRTDQPSLDDEVRECQHLQLLDETMAHLAEALSHLPTRCQPYRGNALLNLALGQLVDEHGQARTARLVARVVTELARDDCPTSMDLALNPFHLNG